jgi:hypothetical protein
MRYQYGLTASGAVVVYDDGTIIAVVVAGTRDEAMQYADTISDALNVRETAQRRRENPRDRQQSLI